MDKLSVNQFKTIIKTRDDLYDVAVRNGFFVPKLSSSMINESYLVKILNGELFCPKYSEIRVK